MEHDDRSLWYEYLVDSLEAGEEDGSAVPNADPPEHIDAGWSEIRTYFLDGRYPYAQRLPLREYYTKKHALQIELVKLQNWVKETGTRILLIFEGRDAAGKGSTIKRFMEHLNPRGARVIALDKPTEAERGQWYFQRYVDHLPGFGELVFFDRSWYNRAGVERVMGFCTEAQHQTFMRQAPEFERMLVADGIRLFKFYLSVSRMEQARRFSERERNPLKQWKLSPVDVEAQRRWDAYTDAKQDTFRRTDSEDAPWVVVKADDKLRARLETMRYVLARTEYRGRDPAVVGEPDPWLVAPAKAIYEW